MGNDQDDRFIEAKLDLASKICDAITDQFGTACKEAELSRELVLHAQAVIVCQLAIISAGADMGARTLPAMLAGFDELQRRAHFLHREQSREVTRLIDLSINRIRAAQLCEALPGPTKMETRMDSQDPASKTQTVRVQMTFLNGRPVPGRALVYDERRVHCSEQAITEETAAKLGESTGAFFDAVWVDNHWAIGDRAPA